MTTYSKTIRAAVARTENTTVFAAIGTDPNKPNYAGPEYLEMLPDVQIMRHAYGGTKALRDNGKRYLPRHPQESEDKYRDRLKIAVMQNMTRRAVGGLVGLVFRNDPQYQDVPNVILEDFGNIDQQGADLPVFAKRVAEAALRDGLTWVHEEYPIKPVGVRTKADAASAGLRPYWVHIPFDDAINWRYEFRNGVPELVLFVYRERVSVSDGEFGQKPEERFRVLRPGSFEVWAERTTDDGKTEWVIAEDEQGRPLQGDTSLPYIPVDPVFGGERYGPFTAKPALLDVAFENLEHARVRSDYQHALSFCSQPVPWANVDAEGTLAWGSDQFLKLPMDASAGVLESSGVALGASVTEMARIEQAIASLSLSMLVGRHQAAPNTATGELIEKAEGDSELATFARSLQAAFNSMLKTHGEYRGIAEPGKIIVNRDFSSLVIDAGLARVLLDMVVAGKLTDSTMWKILRDWEVLPDDFDAEVERDMLDAQTGTEMRALAAAMRERPPDTDAAA